MQSWITYAAALTGSSGVLLGAYGAHGLQQAFPSADLTVWRTAVLYHLLHAVALLALSLHQRPAALAASEHFPQHRSLNLVAAAFVLGVLLFSGSLYLLVTMGSGWGAVLGPLTPVGGVVLVAGWLLLLRR